MENIIEKYEEKKARRRTINIKHAKNGVVFEDLDNSYVDESVKIGEGSYIGPNVEVYENTQIGKNCKILAGTYISGSKIGDGTVVDHSVIKQSSIGKNCSIGPFAYIRPNSQIGSSVKIGDFVEIKNATIKDGSKVSHLTYVGDADVGEGVNLGCGVVFVNYDGEKKSRSQVAAHSFIGCNSNIIAPVNIGEGAYVAAGTTVTKDAPPDAFVIGRAKQETKPGLAGKLRGRLRNVKK